ncbi:MAG: SIMPL domain-containing protein [Pseudomonadales bacterium]|jgi:predicted secreted protein|nr:SIMPL domain-containing protein [Pseudomonadales bacterium]
MKLLHPAFAVLLPLLFAIPAQAQNQFNLGTLQDGQLLLNLSTTTQRDEDQDTLNAELDFVQQGRDRGQLQDQVNAVMAKALELLKDATTINSNTSSYQAVIVDNGVFSGDVTNPAWRVQQHVILRSTDSNAVLDVAGKLQGLGLTMSALYYSLSTARYEAVAAELTTQALGALQQRAEAAARALGKGHAALVEVSTNDSYYMPQAQMGIMAISRADPVANPGKTQVTVNLSARAVLSP